MWKDEPCVGYVDGAGGVAWCMGKKGRRCVVVCACEKMRRWFKTGRAGGVFVPFRLSF